MIYSRRLALLLMPLLAALVLQAGYLIANSTPQHWDPSNHSSHAMNIAREIAASPVQGLLHAAVLDYAYYPPGFHITTAPAYLLFGFNLMSGQAWQILYLLLTLLLIAHLTARFSTPWWGALAALLYLGFPVVLGLGRMVWIENLLALQVVLFASVLLADTKMVRMRQAVLLGLVAGWGQLTKWQFLFFAAPLAAGVLTLRIHQMRSLRAPLRDWLGLAWWCTLATSVCAIIAAPWYLAHFQQVQHDVYFNAYVKVMGNAPALHPSSIFYYLQSFPAQLIGLPLSLAVIGALVAAIATPRRNTMLFLLAATVVAGVTLTSVAPHKQGRFIMPLLPLCAVVVAIVTSRSGPAIRRAAPPLLLMFSAWNGIAQTFDLSRFISPLSVPIGFGRQAYIVRYGTPEWLLPPISTNRWGLDEMFGQIVLRAKQEGVRPTVAWNLKDDHPFYNANTLHAYTTAHGENVRLHKLANFWICRMEAGSFYADGAVVEERLLHTIGVWNLPDGSEARLYRCLPSVPPLDPPCVLKHNASDLYFPGFHAAEKEHRWTSGKVADIELPIREIAAATHALEITLELSGLGDQRTEITFNGNPAWSGTVSNKIARYSFRIPSAQMTTTRANIVRFHLPDACQPNPRDTRILGAALREISIRPVTGTD